MERHFEFTEAPLQPPALIGRCETGTAAGAVITFLGVVRGTEAGKAITALEYEAFPPMAAHQFEQLFKVVEERWPVTAVRVIHRLGRVPAGEPSLWVELAAPHRAEAFAACQFLIDEMKRVVPIWKKVIP